MSMFTIDTRPTDPPWAGFIASLDRDNVLRHANVMPDVAERVRPVKVETVRLDTLLHRHGVERIDLMHVDAEGFDDHIVEQIDTRAPWAPRYVIFENKHLSPARYRRARAFLRERGYRVVNLWPDAFAYRKPPW